MEDIANSKTLAGQIACFIEEHKGMDTVALYIGAQSSFTDCFVIATVASDAHMRGIHKNMLEFLKERNVNLQHRRKSIGDEGWLILDCGTVVIHLMTQEKRNFYDLERLWFEGEILFQSSSKSS